MLCHTTSRHPDQDVLVLCENVHPVWGNLICDSSTSILQAMNYLAALFLWCDMARGTSHQIEADGDAAMTCE